MQRVFRFSAKTDPNWPSNPPEMDGETEIWTLKSANLRTTNTRSFPAQCCPGATTRDAPERPVLGGSRMYGLSALKSSSGAGAGAGGKKGAGTIIVA